MHWIFFSKFPFLLQNLQGKKESFHDPAILTWKTDTFFVGIYLIRDNSYANIEHNRVKVETYGQNSNI